MQELLYVVHLKLSDRETGYKREIPVDVDGEEEEEKEEWKKEKYWEIEEGRVEKYVREGMIKGW